MSKANFIDTLAELDGGIFEQKISAALAETAVAVVNSDDAKKTGKITIELTLERIGNGAQINMAHKLTYKRPLARGNIVETNETSTLVYCGKGGALTITPDTQLDLITKTERQVA